MANKHTGFAYSPRYVAERPRLGLLVAVGLAGFVVLFGPMLVLWL